MAATYPRAKSVLELEEWYQFSDDEIQEITAEMPCYGDGTVADQCGVDCDDDNHDNGPLVKFTKALLNPGATRVVTQRTKNNKGSQTT